MLKFEKTEKNTSCYIKGSLDEISTDLIFCIGMVHNAVSEKSTEAGEELRRTVETALEHGSDINQSIFEHFQDNKWLGEQAKKVKKENSQKLKEDMRRFMEEMLKGLSDDED